MAGEKSDNTVEFGRVIYVEPNNNINGTGRGTNFTFDPEDYSILVDLQVDVVDRFAYNSGTANEQIQFTLEWDAKGTKTSMFKGTNGLLTTKALDTSFRDITDNLNQEAIGINSIDIRYNSWNYPEVTIRFTDTRGASLMATSDYIHEPVNEGLEKAKYADNFANSFFSTFFMFPYPRYTLIVKGFYGTPVSYSLCINDFKTKFNSSTGNFDVTVSFIGYMYGLLTDVPMRLLYAAPYDSYAGAEYWASKKESGDFTYEDSGTEMVTFLQLLEAVKCISGDIEKDPEVAAAIERNKKLEENKRTLTEINAAYNTFINQFKDGEKNKKAGKFLSVNDNEYFIIYSECPTTGDERFDIDMDADPTLKSLLYSKIYEYNKSVPDEDRKIPEIPRIDSSDSSVYLKGVFVYKNGKVYNMPGPETTLFCDVDTRDYDVIDRYLENTNIPREISPNGGVAVCILRVGEFDKKLRELLSSIDSTIQLSNQDVKASQEKTYEKLLDFRVSLKNVIDMTLAHLDTLMTCIYTCMDDIKGKSNYRDFSKVRLDVMESDVAANVDTIHAKSPLYLPPFFAFRKKNPKNDEYEDEWIGNDRRFSDREIFKEIALIDGLLNGILKSREEAHQQALDFIRNNSIKNYGEDIGIGRESPTFINDFAKEGNPYLDVEPNLEDVIAEFAYRCMLASVYSMDYPNIGNRFTNGDGSKGDYFKQFGENDAMCFAKSKAFETFKENYAATKNAGSGNTTFELVTWDNFKKYITGEKDGLIKDTDKGQLYFSGLKTPPFAYNTSGKYFTISCGDKENNKIVVPMNHKSPQEATTIVERIIENGTTSSPETDGFGISRKVVMPIVDLAENDSEFRNNFEDYKKKYGSILKNKDDGELSNIGLYFKKDYVWKEYFSGLAESRKEVWFPSVALTKDIDKVKRKKDNGILYNGSNGSGEYAKVPGGNFDTLKDFFFEEDNPVIKTTSVTTDDYIEKNVIEQIVGVKENVTVYGLSCGQGTLFESELYALQGENNNLARAFLFLHSLPTSEYGAFGRAVSTIIKRTYTPSVTDIPKSIALFIGALYWRDNENGCQSGNNGSGVTDTAITYGSYKNPGSRQLITYGRTTRGVIQKIFDIDTIIKPLIPIKNDEKTEYLTLISKGTQDKITAFEKRGVRDNKLRKYLEGNTTELGYEPFFCGFWDVPDEVKKKFIDFFINWAESDFKNNIDTKLSLKHPNGERFIPGEIKEYKEVVSKFGSDGKATGDYNGQYFKLEKGDTYNAFIQIYFSNDLMLYHTKLGCSNKENSLITAFRTNTEPVRAINSLLTDGCVVKAAFPRVLMTRDMFSSDWIEEVDMLKIGEAALQKGWETFHSTILDAIKGKIAEEDVEKKNNGTSPPSDVDPSVKLSLYMTLKNLHDKWLVATNKKKYEYSSIERDRRRTVKGAHHSIADNFFYINSFYEYVGDEIMVNIEELPEQLEKVIHSTENSCSLYSFMYDVANQSRVQLLALPVFNDMANPNYVRQMFTPIPYDDIKFEEVNTETQYIFMYPEEPSKHLNLESDSRYGDERYKYQDDSFTFVEEGGTPMDDGKMPATFRKTPNPEDPDPKKRFLKNVPVIGVTFAKQNQGFFKNINVSMDNPKTTEVGIQNTFLVAEKFNNGNVQATALGQDLFPIYSNYSYECSVEMMGCACIMPLMYFQLNNLPLFKGTYIIYNVNHTITPGNMTTSFVGQRLSRFRTKRNENSIAAAPDDVYNAAHRITSEQLTNGGDGYCYTYEGVPLEHESDYNDMARKSGVSKEILRAVEYAEVRYNGGFFDDRNLRIYYDPYQARAYSGQASNDLWTENQFDTAWTFSNNYNENVKKIGLLEEEIKEKNLHPVPGSAASSCTITGAFGIPGQLYNKCGASSVEEFLKNSGSGFKYQGDYFVALLNKDSELKRSLQTKNWEKFANRYKSTGGVTETGVFMPGDSSGFPKYVAALEEGYRQAVEATSVPAGEPYVVSKGQDFDLESIGENSKQYAMDNPLDIRTACITIRRNAGYVYQIGNCKELNKTGKDNKGKDYVHNKIRLVDTPEHIANPGTKPKNFSLSLCATYVKCALQAGGYPYLPACNGGFCGPILKDRGWVEIYTSSPSETPESSGFNSKWQNGDIMTIEAFNKHEYGHIMMWDGNNWISDFVQTTCKTYKNDWKDAWNAGKYHVWRYYNRKNI